MQPLELYSYFRSSAAFRVRIGLHLKQIPFNYHAVHLLNHGGEQNLPEFRKLNPLGEVPCIVHQGVALSQSMAILQYLDALVEQPRLFPIEPLLRARVVQVCEMVNCGMHPLQNLKVLKELELRFGADAGAKEHWVQTWIGRGFSALEAVLASTAGTYCFGDEVSAADLYVVPQVFTARRFNADLSAYPVILRITDNCLKLKAFQDSEPTRQPDTPPS